MKIAVDIMSGDRSPAELIRGCVLAAKEYQVTVIIVGSGEVIYHELKKYDFPTEYIEVLESDEVIGMSEPPAIACRKKKNASVMIAAQAVKENLCEAFFSPGNTGATLAAALMMTGRLKGVKRPAIASPLPTIQGHAYILDAGANVDCLSKYLVQFALMGETYSKYVLDIKNPKVGLLSIGHEESKGNELVFKTHQALKKIPFHYIGHVESKEIFSGKIDVIVCDGFVGNIVLKEAEGLGRDLMRILKTEIKKSVVSKMGAALMMKSFKVLKKRTDASEYGGAPLLGVNGSVLIGHGGSDAKAVQSAVKTAVLHIANDVTHHMEEAILKWGM
ncbi:phosphate acyltransferase PlsX [Spirochaetota bacterium]